MRRLGDLIEGAPRFAGEGEGQTEFLAHRGVDGDHQHDAHRRPGREAAERLGPELGPVPAPAYLESCQPVDLVEVVVGPRMARVVLARGRLEGAEVRSVVLGAGHQHDALEPARRRVDRRNGVHQQVAVGDDVLRVIGRWTRTGLEGGEEHVRGVREALQLRRHVGGIEQIYGDVAHRRPVCAAPARQPHHLPIRQGGKLLNDVAPDHALGADDDGGTHVLIVRQNCFMKTTLGGWPHCSPRTRLARLGLRICFGAPRDDSAPGHTTSPPPPGRRCLRATRTGSQGWQSIRRTGGRCQGERPTTGTGCRMEFHAQIVFGRGGQQPVALPFHDAAWPTARLKERPRHGSHARPH